MKCPHCHENFFEQWQPVRIGGEINKPDADGTWSMSFTTCPSCNRLVVKLKHRRPEGTNTESLVRPRSATRSPLPPEVPEAFAVDYREACLVLPDSPKASAALSRRCLQHLLRELFGVKPGKLVNEIKEVLPKLPSYLAADVDAVRNMGNFAAHPEKSTHTAEILDVEPGEAEWGLDVLESLFSFCFVQPELSLKKREALNQKLAEAGKPPMNEPPGDS